MFIYMTYTRHQTCCQNIISKPLGSYDCFAMVKSFLEDTQDQISSDGRGPVHYRSREALFIGDRNLIFPSVR